MTTTRRVLPATLLLATSALALSACKFDNRPLLARNEPAPVYGAPGPGPLDPGYSTVAYLPPQQAYAYPTRAYEMSRIVHKRPPSYAFAYEDEQPWAWETADQSLMFAEPVGDSWRYYYYEPDQSYPYFVQDVDYGYAYGEGGALIALFDAAGVLVSHDRYDDYLPRADRYWSRAYDMRRSYWNSPRRPVQETFWRERAPRFVETHDRWFRSAERQPAWGEALHHDNGRHLGWYKVRQDDRRQDFAPAPAMRRADARRDDRGPEAFRGWAPQDRARYEAQQRQAHNVQVAEQQRVQHALQAQRAQRSERDNLHRWQAQHAGAERAQAQRMQVERVRAQEAHAAQARLHQARNLQAQRRQEAHGPAGHGPPQRVMAQQAHAQRHGPPARAAEAHGHDAAARVPAQARAPQPHPGGGGPKAHGGGGPHGQGGGHGGGKDKGH